MCVGGGRKWPEDNVLYRTSLQCVINIAFQTDTNKDCNNSNGGCQQVCDLGTCDCNDGFVLNANGLDCDGKSDGHTYILFVL